MGDKMIAFNRIDVEQPGEYKVKIIDLGEGKTPGTRRLKLTPLDGGPEMEGDFTVEGDVLSSVGDVAVTWAVC